MNNDVVISTRIRLARNLSDYNFPSMIRGTPVEGEIVEKCISVLKRLGGFDYHFMNALTESEKASLVERYVISRNLSSSPYGAVAMSKDGLLSVMINEEDHVREQCMVKGLDFEGCLARISSLDRILGVNCRFAAKNGFYYTACPTNLGTGMRASLMVFLPSLTYGGRIGRISELAANEGITIRGALGEGSYAECYYYQISNAVTIGDPKKIIDNVKKFALSVCDEENELRIYNYNLQKSRTRDDCLRALGILTHSVILPYGEFCELISKVKLGISLGIIICNNSSQIDDLAVTARSTTLLLNSGGVSGDGEDEKRASYVKAALRSMAVTEA